MKGIAWGLKAHISGHEHRSCPGSVILSRFGHPDRARTCYICTWATMPTPPPGVTGPPASGSRQYLILCTLRLSLFLNFLLQPLHTTLVGSEWTFLMCIQTRFFAYPMDLLVELGKYPHNPH